MPTKVHVTWFPAASGPRGEVTWDDPSSPSVLDLLARLAVTPDTVLIVRDGRPIPVDATLADGDEVRIVRTVSGG